MAERNPSRSETEIADFAESVSDGWSDYTNMPPLMDPSTGVIQPPANTGNAVPLPEAKHPSTLDSKASAPAKKAANAKRSARERKGLKPAASPARTDNPLPISPPHKSKARSDSRGKRIRSSDHRGRSGGRPRPRRESIRNGVASGVVCWDYLLRNVNFYHSLVIMRRVRFSR